MESSSCFVTMTIVMIDIIVSCLRSYDLYQETGEVVVEFTVIVKVIRFAVITVTVITTIVVIVVGKLSCLNGSGRSYPQKIF